MKTGFILIFSGLALFLLAPRARAADDIYGQPQAPRPTTQDIPLTPGPYRQITGTVTVRLDGVPVAPQELNYICSPEVKSNTGIVALKRDGTYFLQADNLPFNIPFTLRISAAYNDSVTGADGRIERQGRSYTGAVKVDIPL